MRRKWREVMFQGVTTATSKAAVGDEYCNKLFALERKWASPDTVPVEVMRQTKAQVLLDTY